MARSWQMLPKKSIITWSLKGSVQFMSRRSSPSSFSREFPSNFFSHVEEKREKKGGHSEAELFVTGLSRERKQEQKKV